MAMAQGTTKRVKGKKKSSLLIISMMDKSKEWVKERSVLGHYRIWGEKFCRGMEFLGLDL